ncbi:hypothetical protein [Streptomyces lavendofoliae]|uniref:hypothetical protein n=1 Tax=Streptomyces lavendofoliae TaxID=67314 RepID=UPI003D90801D
MLDPQQPDVALKVLEPQLRREHKGRIMARLVAGTVFAIGMLGAGMYVAKDSWWLSILLCGPSPLALVKICVLRRSDPADMHAVSVATRRGKNAAQPPAPPAPPPDI